MNTKVTFFSAICITLLSSFFAHGEDECDIESLKKSVALDAKKFTSRMPEKLGENYKGPVGQSLYMGMYSTTATWLYGCYENGKMRGKWQVVRNDNVLLEINFSDSDSIEIQKLHSVEGFNFPLKFSPPSSSKPNNDFGKSMGRVKIEYPFVTCNLDSQFRNCTSINSIVFSQYSAWGSYKKPSFPVSEDDAHPGDKNPEFSERQNDWCKTRSGWLKCKDKQIIAMKDAITSDGDSFIGEKIYDVPGDEESAHDLNAFAGGEMINVSISEVLEIKKIGDVYWGRVRLRYGESNHHLDERKDLPEIKNKVEGRIYWIDLHGPYGFSVRWTSC